MVEIQMGHIPYERFRKTVLAHPGFFSLQEFQCSVGAHMHDTIRMPYRFQPAVKRQILVVGRQGFVMADLIGIGMEPPGRLHSQQHIAECNCRQDELLTTGHDGARRRSPFPCHLGARDGGFQKGGIFRAGQLAALLQRGVFPTPVGHVDQPTFQQIIMQILVMWQPGNGIPPGGHLLEQSLPTGKGV
jgi:hypothetical protein